jgi:hypothetical protein
MHKAAAFVNIKQPEVITATEPALDQFPAPQDFLKFRKQRGVNLGELIQTFTRGLYAETCL